MPSSARQQNAIEMAFRWRADDGPTLNASLVALSRVGISGTTAKSRQRKFVPSSHPGPFALVASSHKSQTKVGTLACFDSMYITALIRPSDVKKSNRSCTMKK